MSPRPTRWWVTRESNAELWIVGTGDASCSAGLWRTWVLGVEWDGPSSTAGLWHLDPDPTSRRVHAPDGLVRSPCGRRLTVALEAGSPGEAFVLCAGGEVFRTRDAGASWGSSGTAPGAVALGPVDGDPVVAVAGADACDGLATGRLGEPTRGCARGATGTDVGLSFAGANAGLLLAGDRTYVSGDGGASWRRP